MTDCYISNFRIIGASIQKENSKLCFYDYSEVGRKYRSYLYKLLAADVETGQAPNAIETDDMRLTYINSCQFGVRKLHLIDIAIDKADIF